MPTTTPKIGLTEPDINQTNWGTLVNNDLTILDTAVGAAAPLVSPALTGTPTAPTAAAGTNTTQLATTAFDAASNAVETSRALAAEALKAPLASPTFTGTVTAPIINASLNGTLGATTPSTVSATTGTFSGTISAVAPAFTGLSTFKNGGTNSAVAFGSGTPITGLGSDAYMVATSTPTASSGLMINRGQTSVYASVDLITGTNFSSGWSMQMAGGSANWTLLDRITNNVAISCQSGSANPITFGNPAVGPSFTASGVVKAGEFSTTQTATASSTVTTHSIPILVNGVTMYMRLSATP